MQFEKTPERVSFLFLRLRRKRVLFNCEGSYPPPRAPPCRLGSFSTCKRGLLFSFCACGAKEFYLTARGHTLPLALPHADLGVSAPARGGCFSLFALWAPHSWPHLRGAAERSEAGGAIAVLSQPPPSFAFGKSHLPQRWRQDMSLFTKGLHNPTISPLARAV